MRKEFAEYLLKEMDNNPKIRVITGDLGFGILDDIRKKYPDRFWNVGAAEHLMVGAAIGLAQEGMIPICYSMSSFLLYRPFELIRNYLNYELTNVKLVGSGRDKEYGHDGITHWAHDDEVVLASVPNVKIYKPNTLDELETMASDFINVDGPSYINLKRKC